MDNEQRAYVFLILQTISAMVVSLNGSLFIKKSFFIFSIIYFSLAIIFFLINLDEKTLSKKRGKNEKQT